MATRSVLVVFSLALILSLQIVVARKRVNPDDSKYEILVNRLANVKGIERCNVLLNRFVKSRVVADELQTKLVKYLPTMSINHTTQLRWEKYQRKKLYPISAREKSHVRPDILNCASRNSLLICFYQPSSQNHFYQSMKWFRDTMVQPASTPKVLIVAVTNKPLTSYKTPLHGFFQRYTTVDVEILEISKSVGKSKKKGNGLKRQSSHGFSVHQYNPFTRIYKKQRLTKKVKLFQAKTMDLHGSKIKLFNATSFKSKQVLNSKTYSSTPEMFNHKSKFAMALKSLMNVTYIYDKAINADLMFFDGFLTKSVLLRAIVLKPHLLAIRHIYTPVIFDTQVQVHLTGFLLFFPLMLAAVLMLNLLSKFSQFNPRTWSPLAIFKMLLGQENPTGTTGSLLETLLFILISFTGIFFSNEFSNAVTGILNPIAIERHFNTFEDIRESNITMHLWSEPLNRTIDGHSFENPILKSQVKYHKTYLCNNNTRATVINAVCEMFSSPNTSISFPASPISLRLFGSTIRIDGRTLIKRSGLSELKLVISYPVKLFSPYHERMSDIYWRFYESGFHNTMNLTTHVVKLHKHIRNQYFLKNPQQDIHDSDELDINFCPIYCGILLLGSILAIFVLIVEILLAPSSSTIETRNRVSIEDDPNFIRFEAEFYELEETENTRAEMENEGNSVGAIDGGSPQLLNETTSGGLTQEEPTSETVPLETPLMPRENYVDDKSNCDTDLCG